MWPFNKTYRVKDWEVIRWGHVQHVCQFYGFIGWSAYFMLRNKATGKQRVINIGGPYWLYCLYKTEFELDRAIFKKTGIEIDGQTAKLLA